MCQEESRHVHVRKITDVYFDATLKSIAKL